MKEHLQKNWIFYLLCLMCGVAHAITHTDPPILISIAEVAAALFLEAGIKRLVTATATGTINLVPLLAPIIRNDKINQILD